MYDIEEIKTKMAEERLEEVIEMLDHNVEKDPENAQWFYLRGKVYWRMGKHGNAISDYEEAAHLDPQSPAVHALDFARGIMDYFNPDLMNP